MKPRWVSCLACNVSQCSFWVFISAIQTLHYGCIIYFKGLFFLKPTISAQELLSNLEAELRPVSRHPVTSATLEAGEHAVSEQARPETASEAHEPSAPPAPEPENDDAVSHEGRPAGHTEDSEASEAAAPSSESPADEGAAEPGSAEPDVVATPDVAEAPAGDGVEAQKGTDTEEPVPRVPAEKASYKGTIRLEAAQRKHFSSCLGYFPSTSTDALLRPRM